MTNPIPHTRKPDCVMRDGDPEFMFIAIPLLCEAVCVVLFIGAVAVWAALLSGA